MTLVYCAAAAKAEVARAWAWDRWRVSKKANLGLVPVVDGKCPFCGRDIKTVS